MSSRLPRNVLPADALADVSDQGSAAPLEESERCVVRTRTTVLPPDAARSRQPHSGSKRAASRLRGGARRTLHGFRVEYARLMSKHDGLNAVSEIELLE